MIDFDWIRVVGSVAVLLVIAGVWLLIAHFTPLRRRRTLSYAIGMVLMLPFIVLSGARFTAPAVVVILILFGEMIWAKRGARPK